MNRYLYKISAILQMHLILLALFGSVIYAADISTAPQGYTWERIDEINASILLPNDWYSLKENQGNTLAVFLSKEKIIGSNDFDTGLSFYVFRGNPYGVKLIRALAKKNGSNMFVTSVEPFIQLKIEYESVRKTDGVKIHVMDIVFVNEKTKTSYLLIYESPVSIWEKYWPIGKTMIEYLDIKPDI